MSDPHRTFRCYYTGSSIDPTFQQQQQQQQAYTESGQYQRVFTALLPDELRQVLQHGWEALQVAPVFSGDAGVFNLAVTYVLCCFLLFCYWAS